MTDLMDCLDDCIGILSIEDLRFLQELLLEFAQIYITGCVPDFASSNTVAVNWDHVRHTILSSENLPSKEYLVLTAVQYLDECIQVQESKNHSSRLITFCEQHGMLVFMPSWAHIVEELYAITQTLFMVYYHRELTPSFNGLLTKYCEEYLSPEARSQFHTIQEEDDWDDFSQDNTNY